jgi:purine nucleosidase
LIIDCDPGIDDAVALTLALFDPRVEVLAVTTVAGNVPADQATANAQAIVSFLDPPRLPRLGAASAEPLLLPRPASVHGPDGLGGLELPRVPLHGGHASEKVIWETIKAHPREVTILALGPLTNLSRVLQRDPGIAELIGAIVACGGTVHAAGNATAVADFNFSCDPAAARHVVREPVTKTLVPLETTSQVVYEFDLLDRLPRDFTRAGKILRPMLGHAFRAQRQLLGSEGIRPHSGVRGRHTVAPRSISAWAQSPGRSPVTRPSARRRSSGRAAGRGVSTANSRAMTRSTLPSTTLAGRPKAIAATAAAV